MPLGGRTPACILWMSFCVLIIHLNTLKILLSCSVMRIDMGKDA